MSQDRVFLDGEADAYYRRNAEHYAKYNAGDDPIARAISSLDIQPKKILDLGCSSGERLISLCHHYGARGIGVDPSQAALTEASLRDSKTIEWYVAAMDDTNYCRNGSDLIICSFVLHWVPRERLLRSLAAFEKRLTPDGYVAILDFHPVVPHKRKYHHKDGVWTFKADYAKMLEATGCFEIRYRKVLTYPGYQIPSGDDAGDLCAVTMLRRVPIERMLTA